MAALVAAGLLAAACSSGQALPPVPGPGWVDGPPRAGSGPPAGPERPNIIFVLTDDLSWNLVRYMPHVQAMQRNGVTFSNYFVTDSLCCPSRASIFTGEFPHNDGVYDNLGPEGGFRAFLTNGDEHRTFASVLRGRGYQTGLFGKYLNLYKPTRTYFGQSPYLPPGWSAWSVPDSHGYDEYGYTMAVGNRLGSYGDHPADYLSSVLATKTEEFMAASARAHQPFFAELSTYAPHGPFVPAPPDLSKFPGLKAPEGPAYGKAMSQAPRWLRAIPPLTPADQQHLSWVFRRRAQSVQSVDRILGGIEAEVHQLGIGNDTYLVFSSDNGFHLGEYNLRQGKSTAFDTDVRVPLVVVGPGVPAGRTVTDLAGNVDLAPTFETLSGATPPPNVDGHTLVAQLHARPVPDWRTAMLLEHHRPANTLADPDQQVPYAGDPPSYEALRGEEYLYVEYADGERELHLLQTDPYELDNSYGSAPTQLQNRLHSALQRLSVCRNAAQCWAAQQRAPVVGETTR